MKRIGRSIKRRLNLFLVNKVYAGTKPSYFSKKRALLNAIGYDIGEGTKVVGPIYNTGTLVVGANCWIGKNLTINGNGKVIIGDNCDIAPEVTFQTGSHQIGDESRRAGAGYNADIKVGNGTWIGVRTTILNDVTIGNSCVVAACACVAKNVSDNQLVGGVPAKTIREL